MMSGVLSGVDMGLVHFVVGVANGGCSKYLCVRACVRAYVRERRSVLSAKITKRVFPPILVLIPGRRHFV